MYKPLIFIAKRGISSVFPFPLGSLSLKATCTSNHSSMVSGSSKFNFSSQSFLIPRPLKFTILLASTTAARVYILPSGAIKAFITSGRSLKSFRMFGAYLPISSSMGMISPPFAYLMGSSGSRIRSGRSFAAASLV